MLWKKVPLEMALLMYCREQFRHAQRAAREKERSLLREQETFNGQRVVVED